MGEKRWERREDREDREERERGDGGREWGRAERAGRERLCLCTIDCVLVVLLVCTHVILILYDITLYNTTSYAIILHNMT